MITADEEAERMRLYNEGLTDKQMGEKLFLDQSSVNTWRKRHNPKLPPNHPSRDAHYSALYAKYKALYDNGDNDTGIADKTHTTISMVRTWRSKNELPSNHYVESELRQNEYAKLYNRGVSDWQIGKMLGVSATSVLGWRRKNGYPAKHKRNGAIA